MRSDSRGLMALGKEGMEGSVFAERSLKGIKRWHTGGKRSQPASPNREKAETETRSGLAAPA